MDLSLPQWIRQSRPATLFITVNDICWRPDGVQRRAAPPSYVSVTETRAGPAPPFPPRATAGGTLWLNARSSNNSDDPGQAVELPSHPSTQSLCLILPQYRTHLFHMGLAVFGSRSHHMGTLPAPEALCRHPSLRTQLNPARCRDQAGATQAPVCRVETSASSEAADRRGSVRPQRGKREGQRLKHPH
ncbi:unnamed protein product [Boreogadus saida]